MKIAFICTGNTCRSPMAQFILTKKLKEAGVEARPFWKPVHLQKPYEGSVISKAPVSEGLWQRIVVLPCSTNITDEDMDVVANAVKEIFTSEN